MTRTLHEVMREQADAQAPPHFDTDAIVSAGNRHLRRTRTAVGSLVAATVALTAVGLPHLLAGVGTKGVDSHVAGQGRETAGRFAEHRPSYAVGEVIHWGRESFSVGAPVSSFVQTDDGFVYATKNGDVWFYDGTDSQQVGHTENRRLRSDDTGSLVAWVGSAEDGHPQYVVFDTSSRSEVRRVDDLAAGASKEQGDLGAEVFAVDDGAAFWRTGEGVVRYDVDSGKAEVIARPKPVTDPAHKPSQVTEVTDVAGGQIAYLVESERGSRMMVGRSIDSSARRMPSGWHGVLSPDGAYLGVEDDDELAVYDTATSEEVTPALDDYPFKVVYGWVDEDTAMVFAIKDLGAKAYPVDFLACDVPDGSCSIVSSDEVSGASFSLPVGDPMDT